MNNIGLEAMQAVILWCLSATYAGGRSNSLLLINNSCQEAISNVQVFSTFWNVYNLEDHFRLENYGFLQDEKTYYTLFSHSGQPRVWPTTYQMLGFVAFNAMSFIHLTKALVLRSLKSGCSFSILIKLRLTANLEISVFEHPKSNEAWLVNHV